MPSVVDMVRYSEITTECSRWYYRNQNTNAQPWGGICDSADQGRFIYEYYPATGMARASGVWAQALAIMALDANNLIAVKKDAEYHKRKKAIEDAGRFLLTLQHTNEADVNNCGGFSECIPGDPMSYPRDAATGAIGMCALARTLKDEKYITSARKFADWYKNYGSDENLWPYITYDFDQRKGHNFQMLVSGEETDDLEEFVLGDWQAGGALAYYYLACLTGERKYIDDYFMPVIYRLVEMYKRDDVSLWPERSTPEDFHGDSEISLGNDDFALVALMCGYLITRDSEMLDIIRERCCGLLSLMDPETGRLPAFGGTFVSGITMLVANDLEEYLGNRPNQELVKAVDMIAQNNMDLQAFDYTNTKINGGFWGQTPYGISRDRIHHRSTGYAAIFYAMASGRKPIPHYHCLHWDLESVK